MPHNIGLHHFHRRKRIYKNYEPYPHPNKWKSLMDKLIYAVIIITAVMTVPQVVQIWSEQNATGVSVYTWSTYFVMSIFWIVYGLLHKEKPIILSSTLLGLLQVFIVAGTVVYG